MKIAPSILACNFSNIGNEIKKITNAGADMVHMDVMDGHFVPNISFGAPIIASIRDLTNIQFDVHLMISNPFDYIDVFSKSGADIITFHIESRSNISETIKKIRLCNKKVGIAIKPLTDLSVVTKFLNQIDVLLVMTVEPGFGGQSFMENQVSKISELRNIIDSKGFITLIEVDGGINPKTAILVKKAGADICVAGTSIFKSPNMHDTILKIKQE